jgi:Beta-lactamase superfamily domain
MLDVDAARRPILHHLNADSSWLFQVPRPDSSGGKRFFNIVIDPWLQGPQSDVASWFSQQWHAEESAVQTIPDVQNLALRAEDESLNIPLDFVIDVIAIAHEFTDHCHHDTLCAFPRTVPVYAPAKAAALIKSWQHFDTVVLMPDMNSLDWQSLSTAPLPSWLTVARIMSRTDALYYHSAILLAWKTNERAECLVYTPHGVKPDAIVPLLSAEPPIDTLALIHGLHDVSLKMTQQLNLGAHNGLKVQRALKPKYWFGTHDEVKKAGGFIKFMLRRKIIGIDEALAAEISFNHDGKALADGATDENVFSYMANGESRILE